MIVRTTMRPGIPIEVDAAEYTDLSRLGLLVVEPQAPVAVAATPVVPVPPAGPDNQENTA
jgi:hypothetical protein